ncbi:MAG: FkbM family methyltransferase [Chloroflexi bacterium]|nr:MAG: FkbM family methyltransferase [Chloroflexota bacterium]
MNKELKSFIRGWLPRRTHKHRIWSGPLRGQWLVTSWHDYPSAILGKNERPLLDWLSQNIKPGETWLDIGSHYGYVALAMSNLVGKMGRVYAFEPMFRTAGFIQQTRQLNDLPQMTIVPLAIAAPKELSMHSLSTSRGMIDSTIAQGDWQEPFYAARLDWLWSQICGDNPHIDGVKIDVQGMEIEAVRGMQSLLKAHCPKLIVEVHKGVHRETLLDLLESFGYSRQAVPVEPAEGEVDPLFLDDRSYAFRAKDS